MLCPNCQVPIPDAHVRELLAQPVGEDVLLQCGNCSSVSILHGAKLEPITQELVEGLTAEKTQELIENILQMRERTAGVEATIELLERAVRKNGGKRS